MKFFLTVTKISLILSLITYNNFVQAAEKVHKPTFLNKCGVTLYQMYISPLNENQWEESLIDNILESGECKKVTFSPNNKTCQWDLMARDQDGNEIVWRNVNLCTEKMLLLHYKSGRAWVTRQGEVATAQSSD